MATYRKYRSGLGRKRDTGGRGRPPLRRKVVVFSIKLSLDAERHADFIAYLRKADNRAQAVIGLWERGPAQPMEQEVQDDDGLDLSHLFG